MPSVPPRNPHNQPKVAFPHHVYEPVPPPQHPILLHHGNAPAHHADQATGMKRGHTVEKSQRAVLSHQVSASRGDSEDNTSTRKRVTLSLLPSEILWIIYLFLPGPFLSKLSILSKSHYNLIHYTNRYPVDEKSAPHRFWFYLNQIHYETQLKRRHAFPCSIHPKILYIFQWAKANEVTISLLNRACIQLESRFRLELRQKVADVSLFMPQLFWYYRQSYKFEKYFQGRDMKDHPLYNYYSGLEERDEDDEQQEDADAAARRLNASKKYYDRQGEYFEFNFQPMTLLIVPKREGRATSTSTFAGADSNLFGYGPDPHQGAPLLRNGDECISKGKLNQIAQDWLDEWNNSQFLVETEVSTFLDRMIQKRIKAKVLEHTEFTRLNRMRKENGMLDRMKIYVNFSRKLLR